MDRSIWGMDARWLMKTIKRLISEVLFFLVVVMFFSCAGYFNSFLIREGTAFSPVIIEEPNDTGKRQWTIMIYMAADNSLETEAIRVINELESFNFKDKNVTILGLLDRSEGHDGTNGNWSDTRLFEIVKDEGGENGVIVSKELSSNELALSEDSETELDMANANTLKNFLKFSYANYQAKNYALIIWGHGGGWRSIISDNFTGTTMSLNSLQKAIIDGKSEHTLDILAFDTAFSATIEMLWEMKDTSAWFIGTPGVSSTKGWDYKMLFTHFVDSPVGVDDFIGAAKYLSNNSIIHLQSVSEVKNAFDALAKNIALQIDSREKQIEIKNLLFSDVLSYKGSAYPTDMYLDVFHFATIISESTNLITNNEHTSSALQLLCTKLQQALDSLSYNSIDGHDRVSVFFISLLSQGVPNAVFPSLYIQGTQSEDTVLFVQESDGWVPSEDENANASLLNKLFFAVF